jgi:2-phospho-L-lactate guanylyltransferase (CobY/MobA/RfbA family)
MQPGDADRLGAAVEKIDEELALADDRVLVLADLVAVGQVGVEVVLPLEDRDGLIAPRARARS